MNAGEHINICLECIGIVSRYTNNASRCINNANQQINNASRHINNASRQINNAADALTMQADALALQGIVKFNSLRINEKLLATSNLSEAEKSKFKV